jgi:hypothetical protein
MFKAYKIKSKLDTTKESYGIYSAENAGKAKTSLIRSAQDAYKDVNYSYIISCRRAPEYDALASKYRGCIAWRDDKEYFEQDKGHWWE